MMTAPARLALSAATSALALAGAPAMADMALPAPYLSRALDAVLLPIDEGARVAFDLAGDDTGVLVLATEPGGVADANGIVPGDVLHMIGGQKITAPIDVDTVAYYWIAEGIVDFDFGIYRDGGYVEVIGAITEDSYWETIEISSIETWSSWSTETSFSYEEFVTEYSETITESYEVSETTIEETVTSEEFAVEMSEEYSEETTEEVAEDMSYEEALEDPSDEALMEDEELIDDEVAADEDEAAEDEDEFADQGDVEEETFDEAAGDEAGEEFAENDMSDDEIEEVSDESADEEMAEDEGYDDGGEDGGNE